LSTLSPTFTWTATAGAATYALQVLDSHNNLVINVMNLTATSYTPTQPLAAGAYSMNVRALNSAGLSSSWSATNAFSVAAPAPVVNLGSQVVSFALSKLNTTVGGGECTDLVEAALQAAGAKTTDDFGVTGLNADYVWGTLVATYQQGDPLSVLANVQPGDIVQYSQVVLKSGFSSNSFPHHSAIVEANLGNGQFQILEQNVNSERWVHQDTQDFSGIAGGTKNNGSVYFAGISKNGEQVLMGFQQPEIITLIFDKDGNLVEIQKRAVKGDSVSDPTDPQSSAFQEMTQWQNEIGFEPGTIRVLPFSVPELYISVTDMPAHFEEFVKNPEAFPSDQRKSLEKEITKWKKRRDFVLNWNEEYWLTKNGVLVSS
jgi:hypothetical protein